MKSGDPARSEDWSVRERLMHAAEVEIAAHGVRAVRMESVAKRAGTSRATAFRRFGTVYDLVVQVAVERARRHSMAVRDHMVEATDVFDKLEAALIYTTRELPTDPSVSALISQHSASARHPAVRSAALEVLGPVLERGRLQGAIRTDVHLDDLVDYFVEHVYLAAQGEDRSEDEVRRRFRRFVVPGLAATPGHVGDPSAFPEEVVRAVEAAIQALKDLAAQVGERPPHSP